MLKKPVNGGSSLAAAAILTVTMHPGRIQNYKRNMDFDTYQKFAKKTAVYPKIGKNFVYPALGLAGETGEVLEKIKKIFRDNNGKINKVNKEELSKELGDILWYISQLSTELGLTLSDVAKGNIDKLSSRMKRGKLQGNGDNR